MDAGDLDGAIFLFERSIAADPHFKALELLGECLVRRQRLREAIVPLAAATALNQGVRAPALLAEVFLRIGDRPAAREMAEDALRRDPANRLALRVQQQTA